MVAVTDDRAERIIKMADDEESKAANFRSLYQQVADLIIPRENQITTLTTPGQDKSRSIYDPTGQLDLQDMVSGLSAAFFPEEQLAFGVTAKDRRVAEIDRVKRYLMLITQIAHDEIFDSNFMLQLNETLSSLVGFGTGNIYSEFNTKKLRLNYRDWDIAFYTFKEDCLGLVDTVILKYVMTARQAVEKFGDKAGEQVLKAVEDLKTESDKFDFIHVVRPRIKRNVMLVDNLNMPFESIYVNVKEKIIVSEGGFEEIPFAVSRWMCSSSEKFGRGQGTIALSVVKTLQQQHKDLIDCGNKHTNPPREVLDTFEGTVNTSAGALNFVQQMGSIKAIEQQALGNFPIGEKSIELIQAIIHRAFYADVFAPLAHLTGDRRTTLEIMERVKQAMKKLALPVYRLRKELFEPVITRSILLLIRNGRIPYPDEYGVPELVGKGFGIKFLGELALTMRDQQARAFQQLVGLTATLDPVFPGAKDIINIDRAMPDIAASFGAKVEHLSTPEEIAAARQKREQDEQLQRAAIAAQTAAEGYQKTSKKAEEGSLAEQVMANA